MKAQASIPANTVPQKLLDDLVRRIVEAVDPERIILFGSAARGEFHKGSDLDVLVVAAEGADLRQVWDRSYACLKGLGESVDIVPATEELLKKYGGNFSLVYFPALRDGRTIYARNAA